MKLQYRSASFIAVRCSKICDSLVFMSESNSHLKDNREFKNCKIKLMYISFFKKPWYCSGKYVRGNLAPYQASVMECFL